MDIYSRDQASIAVSFGARVMVAIGKSYGQSDSETRRFLDSESPTGIWSLSLLLVLWYGDSLSVGEAQSLASLRQSTGAVAITTTLNLFRAQLLPFVQAAYNATSSAQLAGAGVFFRAAADQIGVGRIASAIQTSAVADVRTRLQSQLALPADVRQLYLSAQDNQISRPEPARAAPPAQALAVGRAVEAAEGKPLRTAKRPSTRESKPVPAALAVGSEPKGEPSPPSLPQPEREVQAPPLQQSPALPSRGDRFDRADREVPVLKVPVLAPEERLLAHLYYRGWSPEEIERIAKGPKG